MTNPPKREKGVCGGEGCGLENVWPLHNVRQRGVFQRLCTSCVLKNHPGSFCTICFDFLDGSQSPSSVVHCSSCPSLSHTTCLPVPSDPSDVSHASKQHLCPTCAFPNDFSYFSLSSYSRRPTALDDNKKEEDMLAVQRKEGCNIINFDSAKVLLVAARIATVSMNRAVSSFRMEAERKVKESLVAKRRATELLERAIFVSKKDREKRMKGSTTTTHEVHEDVEMSDAGKKVRGFKPSANAGLVAAQKRIQCREREKLMKFQEPIALAKVAAAAAVGSFSVGGGGLQNNAAPRKSAMEDENEKSGTFLTSNLVASVENKGVVLTGPIRPSAKTPTQTSTSPTKVAKKTKMPSL